MLVQFTRIASQSVRSSVTSRHIRPTSRAMAAASTAPTAPTFSILKYDYVEGILEKRGPFREEHLGAAQAKLQEGKLVMAGGFGSPPEGGLFIFKNSTDEEIEAYVAADPYVKNGLVTGWSVKPYAVAVGGQ